MFWMQMWVVCLGLLLLGFASGCKEITEGDALLIIDYQNCFLEDHPIPAGQPVQYEIPEDETLVTKGKKHVRGGSLAVPGSAALTPILNSWIEAFNSKGQPIFVSIDWHPSDHCSFCRNGSKDGSTSRVPCGPIGSGQPEGFDDAGRCEDVLSLQDYNKGKLMQWPSHCVAGTFGARVSPFLNVPANATIVKKGIFQNLDSYSAFNGVLTTQSHPSWIEDEPLSVLQSQPTLPVLLARRNVRRLFVMGLATDFCVFHSALDALALRFGEVVLVQSASRGISKEGIATNLNIVTNMFGRVTVKAAIKPVHVLDNLCARGGKQIKQRVLSVEAGLLGLAVGVVATLMGVFVLFRNRLKVE